MTTMIESERIQIEKKGEDKIIAHIDFKDMDFAKLKTKLKPLLKTRINIEKKINNKNIIIY